MVQVPLLPLHVVCYFFLTGAFFFAGFAAGLAADRPGLWALQVLHMLVTSLPVLTEIISLVPSFANMGGPGNAQWFKSSLFT